MRKNIPAMVSLLLIITVAVAFGADNTKPEMPVHRCEDFTVTGDGSADAWTKATWTNLRKRSGPHDYTARVKMLYSPKGLYLLFDGTDARLTATMDADFMDLWNEDVWEVFLWPSEKHTVYFEYEISPLGFELPILVPNLDGKFLGWRPWHYEGDRKIQKKVQVRGGPAESGAAITGWTAEVFIPYALLKPLHNVPPQPGSQWRANFYRVDYDGDKTTAWDWSRTGPSFHDFKNFGTLRFQ